MTPMLLLLLLTTCLARVDARLQGLDGVLRLLNTLLDGSARYSLPQAAATSSVRLHDRVVCHVNNGVNDPWLDKTWFVKAMKHAILNNDLAMVQRIHYHHPEPLALYSLIMALENGGSLGHVQWLMEHRHDQMCTSEPPARMTSARPLDCCIRDSLVVAVRRRSFDVCRWLVDQGYVSQAQSAIDDALITGGLDTVRHLLERTKNPSMSVSFVQIAFERGHVRVLQYLHEHGWLPSYSLSGSIGITSDVARLSPAKDPCYDHSGGLPRATGFVR